MDKTLKSPLSLIVWPAVINFEGDDELCYVDSEQVWMQDAESLLYNHRGQDRLIDSNGSIYGLERRHDDHIEVTVTGARIRLSDFIKQVRIHASNSHRCCIEKISFRSIAEGIRLVDDMNTD